MAGYFITCKCLGSDRTNSLSAQNKKAAYSNWAHGNGNSKVNAAIASACNRVHLHQVSQGKLAIADHHWTLDKKRAPRIQP